MSPVQVQKLFFILDRELSDVTGGPYFKFEPYDYGPFDATVYRELDKLALSGFVSVVNGTNPRRYELTEAGKRQGLEIAESLPASAKEYILEIGNLVRRLSFQELVSAIYKKYPEMKVKSVFRE